MAEGTREHFNSRHSHLRTRIRCRLRSLQPELPPHCTNSLANPILVLLVLDPIRESRRLQKPRPCLPRMQHSPRKRPAQTARRNKKRPLHAEGALTTFASSANSWLPNRRRRQGKDRCPGPWIELQFFPIQECSTSSSVLLIGHVTSSTFPQLPSRQRWRDPRPRH